MSHPVVWRCTACGAPLGVVRDDGALVTEGQHVTIGRAGLALVGCGHCGGSRVWKPSRRGRGGGDTARQPAEPADAAAAIPRGSCREHPCRPAERTARRLP